jgi:hypothetical protein
MEIKKTKNGWVIEGPATKIKKGQTYQYNTGPFVVVSTGKVFERRGEKMRYGYISWDYCDFAKHATKMAAEVGERCPRCEKAYLGEELFCYCCGSEKGKKMGKSKISRRKFKNPEKYEAWLKLQVEAVKSGRMTILAFEEHIGEKWVEE